MNILLFEEAIRLDRRFLIRILLHIIKYKIFQFNRILKIKYAFNPFNWEIPVFMYTPRLVIHCIQ